VNCISNKLFKYYVFYSRLAIIPVTRRVKGYTRYIEKYVTGRRKSFRPYKVYIYLDQDHNPRRSGPVRLSILMNVDLGTIKARRLRLSIQILERQTQRKFVGPCCHAHSNAH